MKVKEESENIDLKLNIQKTKIMASGPINSVQFSSVQFSCSVMSDSLRPHELQYARPSLSVTKLPELTQTHVHQVSDAIHPSHPLLSPSPPAPNPSQLRVFSNESTLRMWWPKYWSFTFSIIPFKEIPGMISFRMDWLDLLAVQGILKSLLQHHSSKAPILWRSAFSQSNFHSHSWPLEKPEPWLEGPLLAK